MFIKIIFIYIINFGILFFYGGEMGAFGVFFIVVINSLISILSLLSLLYFFLKKSGIYLFLMKKLYFFKLGESSIKWVFMIDFRLYITKCLNFLTKYSDLIYWFCLLVPLLSIIFLSVDFGTYHYDHLPHSTRLYSGLESIEKYTSKLVTNGAVAVTIGISAVVIPDVIIGKAVKTIIHESEGLRSDTCGLTKNLARAIGETRSQLSAYEKSQLKEILLTPRGVLPKSDIIITSKLIIPAGFEQHVNNGLNQNLQDVILEGAPSGVLTHSDRLELGDDNLQEVVVSPLSTEDTAEKVSLLSTAETRRAWEHLPSAIPIRNELVPFRYSYVGKLGLQETRAACEHHVQDLISYNSDMLNIVEPTFLKQNAVIQNFPLELIIKSEPTLKLLSQTFDVESTLDKISSSGIKDPKHITFVSLYNKTLKHLDLHTRLLDVKIAKAFEYKVRDKMMSEHLLRKQSAHLNLYIDLGKIDKRFVKKEFLEMAKDRDFLIKEGFQNPDVVLEKISRVEKSTKISKKLVETYAICNARGHLTANSEYQLYEYFVLKTKFNKLTVDLKEFYDTIVPNEKQPFKANVRLYKKILPQYNEVLESIILLQEESKELKDAPEFAALYTTLKEIRVWQRLHGSNWLVMYQFANGKA